MFKMAGGIPVVYRKGGEAAVASYDFYDFASKTGYKSFYGTHLVEGGSSSSYALTTEQLSNLEVVNTQPYSTNVGGATALDLDFDMDVSIPIYLRGKGYVSVPLTAWRTTTAANVTITINAALYKVSSTGVETQLGSTASVALTWDNLGATEVYKTFIGRINVPATTLKNGEKLRLNLTSSAPGTNNNLAVYHDSKGYGVTAAIKSTTLQLIAPFRIDL